MTGHHADHRSDEPPALVMSDDDFLAMFERGDFSGDAFPHRAHLRMAWLYVTSLGPEEAIRRAAAGIRNLAQRNGRPGLYHDTLTRAWVYAVAAGIAHCPPRASADSSTSARNCSTSTCSSTTLSRAARGPRARATWVAPDLKPIPGAPSSSP